MNNARKIKQDEFYTQLSDIENELQHYQPYFRNKVVLCNCDNPYKSNFFYYFMTNFNTLRLKRLITTSYVSPLVAFEDEDKYDDYTRKPYKSIVNFVPDKLTDVDSLFALEENELSILNGDGDFRSPECLELLDEADIVVTNPPFSLFREYIATLMKHNKKFIIIGSINAIHDKDFFPLIKYNKVHLGYGFSNHNVDFAIPAEMAVYYSDKSFDKNTGLIRLGNCRWYTNLDIKKEQQELELVERYDPKKYPKYDNYNAIEVGKIVDIPYDYAGIMGVPITFLDKYNPEQFEILGQTAGRNEFDESAWPTKRYIHPRQVNKDGSITNGSKANTHANIPLDTIPTNSVYYIADNADKPLKGMYERILVRNKHPKE